MEESLRISNKQLFRLMPPLNMLLGNYGEPSSFDEILTKLTAVCRANSNFLRCVRQCPDQAATEILIKGQTAWMTICKTFKLYTDSFKMSVLNCWARHGNKMSVSCTAEEAQLESTFLHMAAYGRNNVQNYTSLLCRSVVQHDICYVNQVKRYCDRIALRFFFQLSERSFAAMTDLFRWSSRMNTLPVECQHWLSPTGFESILGDRSTARRRALSAGAHCMFLSPLLIILLTYTL